MNADLDRRTRVTALVNQRNAALAKMREGVDSLTRGYMQAMDAVELEKPVYVGLNEMRARFTGPGGQLVDETNPTRAQIPKDPGMGVHLNTRTQQEAYSQRGRTDTHLQVPLTCVEAQGSVGATSADMLMDCTYTHALLRKLWWVRTSETTFEYVDGKGDFWLTASLSTYAGGVMW